MLVQWSLGLAVRALRWTPERKTLSGSYCGNKIRVKNHSFKMGQRL